MNHRRKARALALQALFYMDAVEDFSSERLELFVESMSPPEETLSFFHLLTHGVADHRMEIDEVMRAHAKNWKLHRMLGVDRNILRIAVFELLYCNDIPGEVTINEAVELAKLFGGEESPRFINGITDQVFSTQKK